MKRILHSLLLPVAFTAISGVANAQLVDCNVYLKGQYLEVGINNNGAFGTSYDPPSGYHSNTPLDTLYNDCTTFSFNSIQGLGFVVDGNQDGWSSGTPAYYGDFVMPGHPREGWAIEDATASSAAYSYDYISSSTGYTGPLTGGTVSYGTSGTLAQGIWQGTFVGGSSIIVKQTATIDTTSLFLHMHIDFYNTGSTPDTFYYLRSVNVQDMTTGSSNDTTLNIIEHQLPDPAGLVVVSSRGLTDSISYVSLGTKDPRAKAFIMKDSTLPGFVTVAAIWAGDTAHYQYLDSTTNDAGIGLVYRIGVGPGDSSYLDYIYSFRGGVIDSVLDSTSIPLQVANNGKAAVHVYPNPANDVVNITGLTPGDNCTLYDIMGRQVQSVAYTGSRSVQAISVSGLPAGIYMVVVRDARGKVRAHVPLRRL